jgi:hypothetical protein
MDEAPAIWVRAEATYHLSLWQDGWESDENASLRVMLDGMQDRWRAGPDGCLITAPIAPSGN